MVDNQLSTMLLYFFGAVALCGAGILALGFFVDVNRHFNKWLLALVNPIVLAATAASSVLSNRDITNAEFEIGTASGEDSAILVWLLRLVTMLVLGICAARLIAASQSHERRPRQGRALFGAFLFFFVTNNVLNDIFGVKPVFDQRLLYPALVFSVAYVGRNKGFTPIVDATKWGLLLFCGACLAAVALFPQAAVQQNYAGVLPSINFRLWGLGTNPNSTGPLALVLLLLQIYRPFGNRALQLLGYGIGLIVLALAQSKTAWAAALIAVPTLWWGNLLYTAQSRSLRRHSAYSLRSFSRPILVCLLGLGAVAALAYITIQDPLAAMARDEQVTSLTGRTDIWALAIDTWKQNPLFGYGTSMWDVDFRRMSGMSFAYHAHNQFLQSLSVAGVLGLLGLLLYTLVLFRHVFAANTATRGFSLALFWVIFIRYFTEAPLTMSSIFSGEFVTHLLLFSVVLTKGREPAAETPAQPQQDYEPLQNLQWR
ncbi:MAG TPA: O-antigen ligase family protein [Noviherbaspirillum sp.]|nr:O-antigen ligase family protein [Noviherbaspirillum sp.]